MTMRILDRLLLLVAVLIGLGVAAGLIFFATSLASGEPLKTTLVMHWSDPQVHDIVSRHTSQIVGTLALDHATLNVRAGGGLYRLAQLIDIILVGGLWLFVTLSMRRLIARIPTGNPFSSGSVKQLRMIGWSLIALNIWAWIRSALLPLALLPAIAAENGIALQPTVAHAVAGPSAQVDASLSATLLICGLIVLALAEAFRIGRDLRSENEAFV